MDSNYSNDYKNLNRDADKDWSEIYYYKCDLCNMKSEYARNVNKHFKEQHMNIKYKCHYTTCDAEFPKVNALRQHVTDEHSKDAAEPYIAWLLEAAEIHHKKKMEEASKKQTMAIPMNEDLKPTKKAKKN